jgi:hypothetical protein
MHSQHNRRGSSSCRRRCPCRTHASWWLVAVPATHALTIKEAERDFTKKLSTDVERAPNLDTKHETLDKNIGPTYPKVLILKTKRDEFWAPPKTSPGFSGELQNETGNILNRATCVPRHLLLMLTGWTATCISTKNVATQAGRCQTIAWTNTTNT